MSIKSDPFDGTISPILFIPDWSKVEYQNKTVTFSDIPIKDYIPLPQYDADFLLDINNTSKASLIAHYTYITPYMGSYRLNYKENDGSHLAVDIRAPIGTPVLSTANGVVVRTVESDASGDKFVVVRHDGISINGKTTSIYSNYLHLSEISVTEWSKVRKWDMVGRVGITGITTTPHLHFQIDTMDAPFHPYWPFTSGDSRTAGLGFYDSINAGLGKENALKYTLHPMTFVYAFAGWVSNTPTILVQKESQNEAVAVNAPLEKIAASMSTLGVTAPSKAWVSTEYTSAPNLSETSSCVKKRFPDIDANTRLGKNVYRLVDDKCMFQGIQSFNSQWTVTVRDAVTMILQYYQIEAAKWTSHFLDVPLGDAFQGYALTAYRRGILEGSSAYPDKILTKEEFVELIVKAGRLDKNPSSIKLFSDVDAMNVRFQSIQSYAYAVGMKGWNFKPKSILSREVAIDLLSRLDATQK